MCVPPNLCDAAMRLRIIHKFLMFAFTYTNMYANTYPNAYTKPTYIILQEPWIVQTKIVCALFPDLLLGLASNVHPLQPTPICILGHNHIH